MKRMSITAIATAVASLIAAMALAGGATAANCVTSQAFAQFGDSDDYTLFKNGSIEGGLSGIAVTGRPSVVSANESFFLHTATDRYSLQLGAGDTASFSTTSLCKKELRPSIRMVARAVDGTGTLRIDVRYKDTSGLAYTATLMTLSSDGYETWHPTPALKFLEEAITVRDQTSGSISLVITPSGTAKWQVDDVFVDPYRSR